MVPTSNMAFWIVKYVKIMNSSGKKIDLCLLAVLYYHFFIPAGRFFFFYFTHWQVWKDCDGDSVCTKIFTFSFVTMKDTNDDELHTKVNAKTKHTIFSLFYYENKFSLIVIG